LNTIVMAVDTPVRDQPVASDIGWRKRQRKRRAHRDAAIKAPAPTTTQP